MILEGMKSGGAARLMRTSLRCPYPTLRSRCEKCAPLSESGGWVSLSWTQFWKWRSVGQQLWTDAWIETIFCNDRMRRNRNIARSRRRDGRCEFSTRLLSQRPISRSSPRPRAFRIAPLERRRLVTITSGQPCRFIYIFNNFNAALRSRVFVTRLSSTSPS